MLLREALDPPGPVGPSGETSGRRVLADRGALVEAGPGLGAELRSEGVDRTQCRKGSGDGDERDHGHQYRTTWQIVVALVDYRISRLSL